MSCIILSRTIVGSMSRLITLVRIIVVFFQGEIITVISNLDFQKLKNFKYLMNVV